MGQINPTVGDLEKNISVISHAYERAVAAGCDLVAFPELSVTGYPPEDLLFHRGLRAQIERALQGLAGAAPGIGVVLIGEGDLSQELGVPRQYDHPTVVSAMDEILAICKENNVVVGHPHVEQSNAERIIGEGYRFLMCSAPRSFATLNKTRELVGRA